MHRTHHHMIAAAAVLGFASAVSAQMRITEWMYNGNGTGSQSEREFIEFTNIGGSPIDLTDWSFDDDSAVPDTVSLSGFGIVAPGESVILAEQSADEFRTAWGLPPSVKVIGDNAVNLGRADTINLFDNNDALVDRLIYGDQDFAGSIRTVGTSGWTWPEHLGTNDVTKWFFSTLGDLQGSINSGDTPSNLGNPGTYVVPEPSMLGLLGLGGMALAVRRRRR